MHFVFEDIENSLNLISCKDLTPSGIGRITVSPVATTLLRCIRTEPNLYKVRSNEITYSSTPPENGKYVIPVGVAHSPGDWCGPDKFKNGYDAGFSNKKSLFHYLSDPYLKDLREGRAFLFIDQTHEGYQTPWLWEWFHNTCQEYSIEPKQIIYITGNMDCADQYKEWADNHNLVTRMLAIPCPHFEHVINEISRNYNSPHKFLPPGLTEKRKLPNYEYHLNYKIENPQSISMFNVLQKRPRAYRLWFFKYLYEAGLIQDNLISMNSFDVETTYYEGRKMTKEETDRLNSVLPIFPKENPANYALGEFVSGAGGDYISSLNDLTMLQSWCTVISEASYGESEGTCFISEKTFKPIVCQHPFIILGSKGSITHLHKLGYKTFHPYINEDYDNLPTWERMEFITKEMKRLNNMTLDERINWYKNLEPILKHNFIVIRNRAISYVLDTIKILKNHMGN